jgi:glycosyltransferase involved in cell wall biosynthesis
MKISVDAGALCSENHFGNYTLTKNFIESISLYDKKNEYYLYSFCDKPKWLKTNKNIHDQKLLPKKFWMSGRVSVEELINPKEIFLALNQAIPFYTQAKVISFSHGLSFYFYPEYYQDSYNNLKKQLESLIKKSTYIVVSSEKVRKELREIFPTISNIKVIPYGIPFDMVKSTTLVRPHKTGNNFFLYVGMNHPIKNLNFLIAAYDEFIKDKQFKNYKLRIVNFASRNHLKHLYQTATAYLTASHYESFNLPVLEALSQNCPVIGLKSAIIPELKKYVYEVSNLKSFVHAMRTVALGKVRKINLNELRKNFSWKRYINRLITLL